MGKNEFSERISALHVNVYNTITPALAVSRRVRPHVFRTRTTRSMSSMEAAASLFGSSDSGSDLDFLTAPEGTNSSSSHSPASAGAAVGAGESNGLFGAAQDSTGLFDAGQDAAPTSSLFDSKGEAGGDLFGQNEGQASQAEPYQPENTYDYGTDAQSYPDPDGQEYNYDEGWFDEHGQWHAYDEQQGTGTTSTSGTNTSASFDTFFFVGLNGTRSYR